MVNKIRQLFPDARVSSGYIRVKCPYHKGGKERKPSMSILLEPRGSMEIGTCHCFACGVIVPFEQLLKDMGGTSQYSPETPEISRAITRETIRLTTTQSMYKHQLPFRFSEYLYNRGIGEEVQKLFKVYEKDGMVNMPVFDKDGKYLFNNARNIRTKYYNIEQGAKKTLYGIEEIDFSKPIVVVEGQIDAMTFWELGMQAVATLGAGNTSALKEIRHATNLIILAFDNDFAGIEAAEKAAKLLGEFRCKYLPFPEGEDINDLLLRIKDKDRLIKLIEKNVENYVHNSTE